MKDIPLRERKHARTKVTLLNTLMEMLAKKRFDDICVKELADSVPISEVTFYNYFPKKTDLLVYMTQMIVIEADYECQIKQGKKGKDAIYCFFDSIAKKIKKVPRVRNEIIAFFMKEGKITRFDQITQAELKMVLPEYDGKEKIRGDVDLYGLFRGFIANAKEKGDIPMHVNPDDAAVLMITVLAGMLISCLQGVSVKSAFKKQLDTIFRGLEVKEDA